MGEGTKRKLETGKEIQKLIKYEQRNEDEESKR